jgi:hypothetical protein
MMSYRSMEALSQVRCCAAILERYGQPPTQAPGSDIFDQSGQAAGANRVGQDPRQQDQRGRDRRYEHDGHYPTMWVPVIHPSESEPYFPSSAVSSDRGKASARTGHRRHHGLS